MSNYKSILTADLHLKLWNDSQITSTGIPLRLQEILGCYRQMCEYAREHDIRDIDVLGDINDTKDIIHQRAFNLFRKLIEEYSDLSHTLLHGNHDASKKESTESAVDLLRGERCSAFTKLYGGPGIVWIPYSNHVLEDIEKAPESQFMFGHFGLSEATFSSGISLRTAVSLNDLKKFKQVFLGHYHKPQTVGNATYIGSPIQQKKDEYGEEKRFIVLDMETGATESIPTVGYRKYYHYEINEENQDNLKDMLKEAHDLRDKGNFVEVRCTLKESPKIDKKFDIQIIHDYQKDINLRGITSAMAIEDQMNKYMEIQNVAKEEKESYQKIGVGILNR